MDDEADSKELRKFFEQIEDWSDDQLETTLAEFRNSFQELRVIAMDEKTLSQRRRLDAYLFKLVQKISALETESENRTKRTSNSF